MTNLMTDSVIFSKTIVFLLLVLFAYLLGSIPTGYLAGRWIKGIDLRSYGSGTVSGSMVWEHVAKWAVFPVGIFDILKGAFPTWLSLQLGMGERLAVFVGLAAVIGHNWPLYLHFHGGRGLSPFIGALLNFFPWGVFILLIGLGLGNLFSSPAIPLLVLILLPASAAMFGVNPFVGFWLSVGMVIITIVKRLEANRRPLPDDPQERRKVILRRIFLDRDLKDHKAWISRTPQNQDDYVK